MFMGLFTKLFGRNIKEQMERNDEVGITPEQFLQTDFVKEVAGKYQKIAIVLNPAKSIHPIDASESKFGGIPNLANFESYPCCDSCNTPLNFVVQLYKKDVPGHYWPENKKLFQLFRCPKDSCPAAYSAPYYADRKMFTYYFADEFFNETLLIPKELDNEEFEPRVPDCKLNIEIREDYPHYEDFDNVVTDIERKFGDEFSDLFADTFSPIQRTKAGGYPSYTQSSHNPECECGKHKEFFFQLCSEDTEPHITNPVPDNWSPHGIMIGDLGNIYFYVCKDCGEKSIESYWDCY